MWYGVGRLRDSSGAQYGMYCYFFPYFRGGVSRLGRAPWPRMGLRGKASVCTAGGTKFQFNVSGQIAGAWRSTDGAEVGLSLSEPSSAKIRRVFRLYGVWRGQELSLDDHQTMFVNFRPDGTLTPSSGYTAPVPEKHANVTLAWGSQSDFEALCANLGSSGK